MNIHLVEPLNNFTKPQDNVWERDYWEIDESKAQQLVEGDICFGEMLSFYR
jgi:hypothetical protein